MSRVLLTLVLFFFNDTATTEIYTLSLHDALPIYFFGRVDTGNMRCGRLGQIVEHERSEEHTSELQSRYNLVCRLLLEKKRIELSVNWLGRRFHPKYLETTKP